MRGHDGNKPAGRKPTRKKSAKTRSEVSAVTPTPAAPSENAVLDTDLHGAITTWNKAAERLFGFRASEAGGQSIRIVIPSARQLKQDELTARAEHGETIDRIDTLCKRRDGSLGPIAMTVTALREPAGDIVGVSRVARDLSGRRRLEPGV